MEQWANNADALEMAIRQAIKDMAEENGVSIQEACETIAITNLKPVDRNLIGR